MMDHYSSMPMPSVEIRTKDLYDSAKKWDICKDLPEVKLNKLINTVIAESKEYSMAGYCVFGKSENERNLRELINLFNKLFI